MLEKEFKVALMADGAGMTDGKRDSVSLSGFLLLHLSRSVADITDSSFDKIASKRSVGS